MKVLKIFTIVSILIIALTGCTQKPTQINENITLNYWGIYEPEENYEEIIRDYEAQNPNVTIKYTRKSLIEYKQQLIARAGTSNGPDIMRFHNSWLPELQPILASAPKEVLSNINFQDIFYPVQKEDLTTAQQEVKGIPLMYDGLVLYYNKDLFRVRGFINPPKTWKDVVEIAEKIKAENNGNLVLAGIAMGSTKNVEYWSDIVSLLMVQNGASLMNPQSTEERTKTAINYYKSFIHEKKVWSETMLNSVDAFAQGKVGMMFGTSWTAFEIQAKNPKLNFAATEVPQLPGIKVGIASYWVEGVTAKIDQQKQTAAWKFLEFLAQKETQRRLYAIQGKNRLFGQPPSRKDNAEIVAGNQYIQAVIDGAPYARSIYTNDKTFGGGLNQELQDNLAKLVEGNNSAQEAIKNAYIKHKLKETKTLDTTE